MQNYAQIGDIKSEQNLLSHRLGSNCCGNFSHDPDRNVLVRIKILPNELRKNDGNPPIKTKQICL